MAQLLIRSPKCELFNELEQFEKFKWSPRVLSILFGFIVHAVRTGLVEEQTVGNAVKSVNRSTSSFGGP